MMSSAAVVAVLESISLTLLIPVELMMSGWVRSLSTPYNSDCFLFGSPVFRLLYGVGPHTTLQALRRDISIASDFILFEGVF